MDDTRFLLVDFYLNGYNYKFNYPESPYKITSFLGTGSTEYLVNTRQKAQGNGGVTESTAFLPREMQLQLYIEPFSEREKLRQGLIHTFTPQEEFTLYVNRSGVYRKIKGRVTSFDIDNVRLYDPVYADIEMICDDPFFQDGEETVIEFLEYKPLINAPLIIPEWGLTAGYIETGDHTKLTNEGDIATGVIAIISADGGEVVNPTITLNDEYIKVLYRMQTGDIITIDTNEDTPNLYINRQESYDWEINSTFFLVPKGNNIIKTSADENTVTNAKTTVIYSNKYFGV